MRPAVVLVGTAAFCSITSSTRGEAPVRPAAIAAFSPVRRLSTDGEFRCSGTIVNRSGKTYAFLTAAHCLYRLGRDGTIHDRYQSLAIDGLPISALSAPRISKTFATCASVHAVYTKCVAESVDDLALIPIAESAAAGLVTWNECGHAPALYDVVVLGLAGKAPSAAVVGTFSFESAPAKGMWVARGIGRRVREGDSGGPAISKRSIDDVEGRTPEICFVVSGVRFPSVDGASNSNAVALLQPAWDLDKRLLTTGLQAPAATDGQ